MSDFGTNGNIVEDCKESFPTNRSMEDLSEYTDADESISTPTEILAEFLSAIMLKDYETALKYCKLILHYEPNNSTAREFYPLIAEKIKIMKAENDSDEDSSSDFSDSASSTSSNNLFSSNEGYFKADSDATSASYSSLEDEEADRENNVKEQGNIPLLAKDIVNGNILKTEESITTEEMLAFNAVEKEEKKSCEKRSEDLKRKLEKIIGDKRVQHTETLKNSSSSANNNINNNINDFENCNLSLSQNLRLYKSLPKQEKHGNVNISYCHAMKLSTEKISKFAHRPPFKKHSKPESDPLNSKIKK